MFYEQWLKEIGYVHLAGIQMVDAIVVEGEGVLVRMAERMVKWARREGLREGEMVTEAYQRIGVRGMIM